MGVRKAVLCDDDALVRSVIARIMVDAGFEVAGEADSPDQAVALVEHLRADTVILDLALRAGHGEELLATLHQRFPDVRIVVFSAYIANPTELKANGAVAVVEKPEFSELEAIVARLAEDEELDQPERRRSAPRQVPTLPPPSGSSISGFEPWQSFLEATEAMVAGDAVIAFDVRPSSSIADVWDDVFRTDFRVAVGRAAGATRRELDRISLAPNGVPVMLVIAGHPEAATAVFERVDRVWRREVASGVPIGAFAHVPADGDPRAILDATIALLLSSDHDDEKPLRML